MAKLKYEVLSPIRLADGELVPVGVVKSLKKDDEDTRTYLRRNVIRLVPGQDHASEGDSGDGESGQNENPNETPQTTPDTPDTPEKTLAELLGEDVASTLEAGGYESVEQVRAATDDDLDAVEGVGSKTIEKIRAALEDAGNPSDG